MSDSQKLREMMDCVVEEAENELEFIDALASKDFESAREAAGFTECEFGLVLDKINEYLPSEGSIDIPWDISDCDDSDVKSIRNEYTPCFEECPKCGGLMDVSLGNDYCLTCHMAYQPETDTDGN